MDYVEYRCDENPLRSDLPACPVEVCAQLVASKWRPLILRELLDGPKRFGRLREGVGAISQKVLTANLREMEDAGLVVRRVYAEVPPHVEYLLTERGESLRSVIDAMRIWGEAYQAQARI